MRAEEVIKKAVKCLILCEDNYGLDNYLDDYIKDSKERAKLSSLLFNYYRNKLTVEYVIKHFADKKVKNKVRIVLAVAIAQMFYQRSIRTEVIVNSTVAYSKRVFGRSTGGFVNAVLRNVERNKEKIQDYLADAPESVKLNIPDFVLKRWRKYYSEEDVLRIVSIIKQPRYYIYYRFVNQNSSSVPLLDSEELGIDKYKTSFTFYKSQNSAAIVNSEELKNGTIYIQDPATSMAVSAVNYKGKGRILDGCSAPGGKTLMLAELYPKCEVMASDRSVKRLRKVKYNVNKAGLKNVKTATCDLINPTFKKESFDVVFLDAPCSNSGVVRKRPDALWKLTDENVESIKNLQKDILAKSKDLVKKGGKLVYSTCSIEHDENTLQIKKYLKENKNFKLEFQQQLLPDEHNDGAFVAVLVKEC